MRIVNNFIAGSKINFCNSGVSNKQKNNISFKQNPIQKGASTAGAWFGFGIGLDFLSRKFHFAKSPTKNSIIINGILKILAGSYTVVKKKKNKA